MSPTIPSATTPFSVILSQRWPIHAPHLGQDKAFEVDTFFVHKIVGKKCIATLSFEMGKEEFGVLHEGFRVFEEKEAAIGVVLLLGEFGLKIGGSEAGELGGLLTLFVLEL